MIETGRKWIGPASDLVEVEDGNGLKHTAVVFHEEWRHHPAITDALGVVLGFLESPMVTGLVELVHRDAARGMFVYPTGTVWSVAEIVRLLSDRGERGGIRAGLELMYTAGQILVEGAEVGQAQGVYSHGGLTPRRVMVKADGQVMVIGHGLPQVEILQFHATPNKLPREDSFRYCPPERIEARPEDCSSDIFGLCLIAFELMTGKPVYDGLVNDIRQQAARGEGSRRLFRFREVLPDPVRHVLTKVLRPEPEARYVEGEDFLRDVHSILADRAVPGPSLMDLMAELRHDQRRVGEQVAASSTQMVDGAELREQLGAMGRSSTDVVASRNPVVAEPGPVSSQDDLEDSLSKYLSEDPSQDASEAVEDRPQSRPEQSPMDARWSRVRRPVRRSMSTPGTAEEGLLPPVEQAPPPLPPAPAPSIDAVQHDPTPPEVPPMGRRQLPRRGARAVQPPPAIPEVSASRRPAPGPSDHGSPPTADDLLLQIRERHGSPPTPSPPASKAEEPRPSDDAIEVTLTGDDDDDCATVMMTPEQLKAKLAEEFLDATPSRPPVTQSVRSVGDAGPVEVHLEGPDGPCRISVPGGITVGEALSRAIGSGLVLPTDQTGTIRGWYRARVGAEAIDPSDDVSVLAQPGAQAVLVVSRTRTVDLVVRAAGKELRFSTPMNTTVPVQSLIKHLVEWLAVGRGDWRLLHQGRPLSSHAILADIDGNDTLTLEFSVGTA